MTNRPKEKIAMKRKKNESRPVVVTTVHRGVFFGYLEKTDGDQVTLTRAKNCRYWTADVRGFMGLATFGPKDGCKIGPSVDRLKLYGVTAILDVSSQAEAAWGLDTWM
jgi:hypothetical protein